LCVGSFELTSTVGDGRKCDACGIESKVSSSSSLGSGGRGESRLLDEGLGDVAENVVVAGDRSE
jgi:hypothetical protein